MLRQLALIALPPLVCATSLHAVLNGPVAIDLDMSSGEAMPRIVPAGTGGLGPADFQTTAGTPVNGINHDGVSSMITQTAGGNFISSAALLWTGRHILTAAHSVTADGSNNINVQVGRFTFTTPSGTFQPFFNASDITIHPNWTGDFGVGFDAAIIDIGQTLDASIPRYNIYTGAGVDAFDIEHTKIGFGRSGTGATGSDIVSGTKRYGQNHYEFLLGGSSNTVLLFDFDNGNPDNDFLGTLLPAAVDPAVTLGLGDLESNSAPGDSGGPTFIEDPNAPGSIVIAGITSFGSTQGTAGTDIDDDLNSSFGELSGDTNVTAIQDWIFATVPEPAAGPLLAAVLVLAFSYRRKG